MTAKGPDIEFLGMGFDSSGCQAVLVELIARPAEAPFAYLVTPNVDHIVRLHDNALAEGQSLWDAYKGATWRTCDSRILARLAKWRGLSLPVVTGSDLTRALLNQLEPGASVAVIGGSVELPAMLRRRYPSLVVRQHRPPMGLRHNVPAQLAAAQFAAAEKARFTILAVGSPQQELLARLIALQADATGIGLCVGAALDFITGTERRAPLAFQKLGLEWFFRLASDPRRLWRRYLVEGPKIFALWWRAGHH